MNDERRIFLISQGGRALQSWMSVGRCEVSMLTSTQVEPTEKPSKDDSNLVTEAFCSLHEEHEGQLQMTV